MIEFVPIPKFEGLYEISKDGQVRSVPSPKGHIGRKRTGALLKITLGRAGYYQVALRDHTHRQSNYLLHRLLAITFIPNPEDKPTVNHKNSVRTDNRIENLEWATYSENNKHAFEFGNQVRHTGEDHPASKLTWDEVHLIRRFYITIPNITLKDLGATFGITPSVVHAIIQRRTWV